MENTDWPNAVEQKGSVQSLMEDTLEDFIIFSEGKEDKDTDLSVA